MSVAVEIDGITCCLGGILVAEGLQELGGIGDRVPGAEEASEVFDGRRIASPESSRDALNSVWNQSRGLPLR